MGPRRFAVAALCGTVVLTGWLATELAGFGSPAIEYTDGADGRATYVTDGAAPDALKPSAMGESAIPAAAATIDAALPDSRPMLPLEPAPVQVATASTPDPVQNHAEESVTPAETLVGLSDARPKLPREPTTGQVATLSTPDPVQNYSPQAASPVKIPDDCILSDTCIDQYLWSLYERAPKVDTIKVREKIKVTVKKKGKTRTITQTVTKLVDENFAWKDPKAAQRFGIPMVQYVIGGMDRSFRLKLYRALRAMDEAGLEPAITSAFRDNYRQALARGNKAAEDSSYHGGSRRGGYGHGLAADLVSVKGATRVERWRSSEALWKWIDAHEKELGIGRPYLDRDPPHVAPIDGKEYADKRGKANAKQARLQSNKQARLATKKQAPSETKKQARLETKKPAQLETKKQARLETKKQPRLETKKQPRLETKKQPRLETNKRQQPTAHGDHRITKPAKTARSSKVKSS